MLAHLATLLVLLVPQDFVVLRVVAMTDFHGTLAAERAYLTDGRGIRLDPATPLGPGAIVRVVVSARAGKEPAGGDP